MVCASEEYSSTTSLKTMTNTELTLDQLSAVAGASPFTTNPAKAQEQMFEDQRLFTYDELKMYYGKICMKISERVPGFQPKYNL